MKNVCNILFGILASICLTLYGTAGIARADGSAIFSMEICADGVAKTVLFDADGNPVEPAQSCPECMDCCHTTGALTPTLFLGAHSVSRRCVALDLVAVQNPVINKRNIYPAPRGPPAEQFPTIDKLWLTTFDRYVIGRNTRSAGRPLFKDATA